MEDTRRGRRRDGVTRLVVHVLVGTLWPTRSRAMYRRPAARLGDQVVGGTSRGSDDDRELGVLCALVGVVALTRVSRRTRTILLVPLLYLAAFVWENRLVDEPSITRQLLLGVLLIVMMISRPHGLLGTPRVERV